MITRHQIVRTRILTEPDEDVRTFNVNCPNCDQTTEIEAGREDAVGTFQCPNCDLWIEYKEYYEN